MHMFIAIITCMCVYNIFVHCFISSNKGRQKHLLQVRNIMTSKIKINVDDAHIEVIDLMIADVQ